MKAGSSRSACIPARIALVVFDWLERSGHTAITSTITLTELLVQPYRAADQRRADTFYGLLSTYPNLKWVAPNLEIADLASRFRADHALRTPDALQIATAVHEDATGFVSNDAIFSRIAGIKAVALDQFLR